MSEKSNAVGAALRTIQDDVLEAISAVQYRLGLADDDKTLVDAITTWLGEDMADAWHNSCQEGW